VCEIGKRRPGDCESDLRPGTVEQNGQVKYYRFTRDKEPCLEIIITRPRSGSLESLGINKGRSCDQHIHAPPWVSAAEFRSSWLVAQSRRVKKTKRAADEQARRPQGEGRWQRDAESTDIGVQESDEHEVLSKLDSIPILDETEKQHRVQDDAWECIG
jgi:hypothetical protein